MPDFIVPAVIIGLLLLVFAATMSERARLSKMEIVSYDGAYPNNHHVLGVGYYHAAGGSWHVHPWNEFREGMGYYWDGEWHVKPDIREVPASVPEPGEIDRVNRVWRAAGPGRAEEFWSDVDRFGFGTAIGRRQGS